MDEPNVDDIATAISKENKQENENIVPDAKSIHYNNVKKKYFDTLGMNRPTSNHVQMGQSAPTSAKPLSEMLNTEQQKSAISYFGRDRTKTVPNYKLSPEKQQRDRSSTLPIPINTKTEDLLFPITVSSMAPASMFINNQKLGSFPDSPNQNQDAIHSDEDSVHSEDENDKFVPPHELLKQSESFNVGTARSLAYIERKQRNFV